MNLIANATYTTTTSATGNTDWHAHVKLARPYTAFSLSQAYQQQVKPRAKDDVEPLTDKLSVTAFSLAKAREQAAAAIEALTGLNAFSTRYVDLREFDAQPVACEEFKVVSEQRAAA